MSRQQSTGNSLQSRRLRMADAAFWRRVCPTLTGLPKRLRYQVSRFRNASSPYASPTENLRAIIESVPADRARVIAEHVVAMVEEVHGDDALPVAEAMRREQEAEARETLAQLRAAADPAGLAAWIEVATEEIAAQRAAIAAARRALFGQSPARAA